MEKLPLWDQFINRKKPFIIDIISLSYNKKKNLEQI